MDAARRLSTSIEFGHPRRACIRLAGARNVTSVAKGVREMSRVVKLVVASGLASVGFVAAAAAATPVKNGVYVDGAAGVIVGVHATNSIHAFNVACHKRTWVAQQFIPIRTRGAFSYSGADFLAKNGRRTSTTGTMTANGRFKTSRLIVGRFSAGGCSGRFSATFSYSLR
jgi:hypothetical protein